MINKIEELEKEIEELRIRADKCVLDMNSTDTYYITALQCKEAELKGRIEQRQETLVEVENFINCRIPDNDEYGYKKDIKQKLNEMKK